MKGVCPGFVASKELCIFKECARIASLTKLYNIAAVLNGDWHKKPGETAYFITRDSSSNPNEFLVKEHGSVVYSLPYFKSIAYARKAISILGEELNNIF